MSLRSPEGRAIAAGALRSDKGSVASDSCQTAEGAGHDTAAMTWMKNWQVSFLALAAIWGGSFWWISVGLSALSLIEVAGARLILGALTLLVVCRASGVRLPRGMQTWRHLAVVALLLNSVPFTLFAFGRTHVSSILAGIINATTPLAALAVIFIVRVTAPHLHRVQPPHLHVARHQRHIVSNVISVKM